MSTAVLSRLGAFDLLVNKGDENVFNGESSELESFDFQGLSFVVEQISAEGIAFADDDGFVRVTVIQSGQPIMVETARSIRIEAVDEKTRVSYWRLRRDSYGHYHFVRKHVDDWKVSDHPDDSSSWERDLNF